ncbi:MAG: DUF234 domain-containing protein, partial [Candidatus Methanosuratincola petrocarbonis]
RKGVVPLPFRLSEVGVWWHKGVEIDAVGKGESGELLFCECKWEDGVDPWRLAGSLREKADYFLGVHRAAGQDSHSEAGAKDKLETKTGDGSGSGAKPASPERVYCLFAKSFRERPANGAYEALHDVRLFDLVDLGKLGLAARAS